MQRWRNQRTKSLESLERREMMATFGFPWPNAHHLTVSFAPDGTRVGDSSSLLFAKLDATAPTPAWKSEVMRAFETWAEAANVDFGVVPDSGDAFGVLGLSRGDQRFGDIRIAAIPLSSGNLSVSVPHDPALSGTWAGDILINADAAFGAGHADLYSVMLHEIGHVLGLDHSADPASVMFSHAGKSYTGLSGADRSAVQSMYGTRSVDIHDHEQANDTFDKATRIKYEVPEYTGAAPLAIFGDITTPADIDYYWVRPIAGYGGSTTFTVRSNLLSPLRMHMELLDANGALLGQATSLSAEGSALSVTLPTVDSAKRYYIKVQSATSDAFAIGRYGVLVSFDDLMTVSPAAVDLVLRQPIDELDPHDVVRRGETSPEALAEKMRFVMGLMEGRLKGLGVSWQNVTVSDVYTVHNIQPWLASHVLKPMGEASRRGFVWHFSRPPIVSIEYEMDVRGCRHERVLS